MIPPYGLPLQSQIFSPGCLNLDQIRLLEELGRKRSDIEKIFSYSFLIDERNKKGELIGFAGVTNRYFVFKTVFLAVKKEYQGKGIGLKLFDKLWVLQQKKPWVTVWKNNLAALKIYQNYYYFIPYRKGKLLGLPKGVIT